MKLCNGCVSCVMLKRRVKALEAQLTPSNEPDMQMPRKEFFKILHKYLLDNFNYNLDVKDPLYKFTIKNVVGDTSSQYRTWFKEAVQRLKVSSCFGLSRST